MKLIHLAVNKSSHLQNILNIKYMTLPQKNTTYPMTLNTSCEVLISPTTPSIGFNAFNKTFGSPPGVP